MSIVATGRYGSIGRNLPENVIGLEGRLEWSLEDMIEELRGLPQPLEGFINFAALSSVKECEVHPEQAYELNVNGAVRWLRAAAEMGCKRFIQVSTSHVFKPTRAPEILAPNRPGDAVAAYGISKLKAEQQLKHWSEKLHVDLAIARVFSVIGKGMRPGYLYANLERRASERDFSPLLGYKNVRDFISAEVVCGQLMRLAQKPGSCMGIFHICSGKPMSVRDLALEVMNENRISPEETSAMFPETSDEANYMISKPSEI